MIDTVFSKQKQLERDEKRIAELDRLFIRLYRDRPSLRGTLLPKVFGSFRKETDGSPYSDPP